MQLLCNTNVLLLVFVTYNILTGFNVICRVLKMSPPEQINEPMVMYQLEFFKYYEQQN